jgi:hypothetical protein
MSDGLPSNEMNYFATHKDKDGKSFSALQRQACFAFIPDDLKR